MLVRHAFLAGVGVVTAVALVAGFVRQPAPVERNLERSAELDRLRRTSDPPREPQQREHGVSLARASDAGDERAALAPIAPLASASREPATLPVAGVDEAQLRLSSTMLRERLEGCREWRRKAHAGGGANEFQAAFHNALFAIAVVLDSQGRATDALGRSVSLTARGAREHRFVTNGNLYSFDCDEFPGFETLRKHVGSKRGVASSHLSDDVLEALDGWTDRALELLSK
jgi:hypothetical protein